MPSSKDDARSGAVFEALADPTRRGILDLLRRRDVMTAGEIAAAFPRITRPAVSRHLRVLRNANLVLVTEDGREWHYRLNIDPLRDMQEEWLSAFTPMWDTSLSQLRRQAEDEKNEHRRSPPARARRRS